MITGLAHARILVADDGFLAAQHTRLQVISAGFTVMRTLSHGDQVLSAVAELKPDILVMNVCLPGQSGIEMTRQLMAQSPLAIVLLTTKCDEGLMKEAIGSGACSYLLKPVSPVRLGHALRFAAIYARQHCCGRTT
ncbi:MAG: response regulator transcription factor [Armatimonas sp.]